VTGSADGATVTLHSVADSGTTNAADAVTSAKANATPLTELIITQLTGALPEASFTAFSGASTNDLAATKVAAAASAVLGTLKTTGIDPGTVDPLKGTLAVGNTHDKLLDQFAARVAVRALPQLVNEVAVAAASPATAAPTTVAELVGGGTLAGCPTALSGRYRTINYWGKTALRIVDFRAMKMQAFDGVNALDLVADPAKPCTFTATATINGRTTETSFALGTSGVGIYRTRFINPNSPGTVGYIFPMQAHTLAGVAGAWSFLQSGYTPGVATDTWAGQFTLGADGKLATCLYDRANNWACGDPLSRTVTQRTDGGFDVAATSSTVAAQVYAYRAPDGNVTLFGTTNPDSDNEHPELTQTSIVGARLQALALPAAGTTENFVEAVFMQVNGQNTSMEPIANSWLVSQVDAATSTVTRMYPPTGPSFAQHLNQPLPGVITRDASGGLASVYQVPLPGLGLTVSVHSRSPATTGLVEYRLELRRP